MEVLKNLKDVYERYENLFIHIILFSISGIFAVLSSKCLAYFLGFTYFGFAPSSEIEVWLSLVCSIMIAIFFCGYNYKFSNYLYNCCEQKLPEPGLSSFSCFVKMFPALFLWGIFLLILILIGCSIFNIKVNPLGSALYYSLFLYLLPFIRMIIIMYSKDFGKNRSFIHPAIVISVVNKTIIPVTILCIQSAIFIIICSVFVYFILKIAGHSANENLSLALKLVGFTFIIYFINILNLLFIKSAVKISKDKFMA